ncbi:MAG TPA: histidine kinase dimerization/phospho-acceptor domain-containing protein, partial [Desulfuromonadales bacterium]|nr:histidine kinase dimerization/phospho-acceptor domain-containing protein [Desulfuromonadales bacterium]
MTKEKDFPDKLQFLPPGHNDKIRHQLAELHENIDFLIHEIRTPLTAIISSAEIVMEESPPQQNSKALLDIIHQEASRIN